jgi:hypothetical protein
LFRNWQLRNLLFAGTEGIEVERIVHGSRDAGQLF